MPNFYLFAIENLGFTMILTIAWAFWRTYHSQNIFIEQQAHFMGMLTLHEHIPLFGKASCTF